MRREGRQHGMVRTYPTLSSPRPKVNELRSAPTAGTFTRVTTKPTNHSKFTGKCGRRKCDDCHVTPASKSKDKVKGAHKMRRVIHALPGFNVSGFESATDVLDYLDLHDYHDRHDNHYEFDLLAYDLMMQQKFIDDDFDLLAYDLMMQQKFIDAAVEESSDDDDGMSFCEVGFVWKEIEGDEESWCFVEEM